MSWNMWNMCQYISTCLAAGTGRALNERTRHLAPATTVLSWAPERKTCQFRVMSYHVLSCYHVFMFKMIQDYKLASSSPCAENHENPI